MVNIDSIESIFIGIAVPYIFYIYILNRQYKYNIIKNEFFYTFIVYLIIIFAVIVVFLNGANQEEQSDYSKFFTEEKKNLMYNQACWKTKKFIDTYNKLYEKLNRKMNADNFSYSDFFNKITNNHSDLIKLDTMYNINNNTQTGGTRRTERNLVLNQVKKLKEILTECDYLITLNSAKYISGRLNDENDNKLIRDLIISEFSIPHELLTVKATSEQPITIFKTINELHNIATTSLSASPPSPTLVELNTTELEEYIKELLKPFNDSDGGVDDPVI